MRARQVLPSLGLGALSINTHQGSQAKGMFKWQWLPVCCPCTGNLAASRMLWNVSVTGRSFTTGHLSWVSGGSCGLWGMRTPGRGWMAKTPARHNACPLPFLSAPVLFTFIFSRHAHSEFLSPSMHVPITNTCFCVHSAMLLIPEPPACALSCAPLLLWAPNLCALYFMARS